jgi:hypothetical protein
MIAPFVSSSVRYPAAFRVPLRGPIAPAALPTPPSFYRVPPSAEAAPPLVVPPRVRKLICAMNVWFTDKLPL